MRVGWLAVADVMAADQGPQRHAEGDYDALAGID